MGSRPSCWASAAKALPELPRAKVTRFTSQYGLPAYDARILCAERPLADYFEAVAQHFKDYKKLSNWFLGELLRLLKDEGGSVTTLRLEPGITCVVGPNGSGHMEMSTTGVTLTGADSIVGKAILLHAGFNLVGGGALLSGGGLVLPALATLALGAALLWTTRRTPA